MQRCKFDTALLAVGALIEGDVFRITIPLSEAASVTVGPELSDVINGTRKFSKTEENILAEIRKNPYITKREICELLGVGKSTVARATKKLKDHGIIVRVGSTKAGYWKY
ncbi:MAG: winged helix-turn-helix transcriptional regulator [Lachnospiraceae bacterium]|nr:winged helix-turn-helix transcriptional regulator [Lachnospiraceae bacterium]